MWQEFENQFVNMHKSIENMENEIKSQNSKYKNLEEKYNILLQKYEEKINLNDEKSSYNNKNNNYTKSSLHNVIQINIDGNKNIYKKDNNNKKEEEKEEDKNEFKFSYKSSSSIRSDSPSHIQSSQNIPNDSFIQSKINIEEDKKSSIYIKKENNFEIEFDKNPSNINDKKYIMDYNSNDKCEEFTSFNINISQPIIAWVTKNENKNINVKNWAKKIFYVEKNAHNSKINKLEYYHNDNVEINNDYIISLSMNDKEENLKIWNIDLIKFKLILVNKIKLKIACFCMFSNKNYCPDYNYLIAYNNMNCQQSINFWKLDSNFNISENGNSHKIIDCSNEVKFLDIYYQKKNNDIYLINCNNYDVKIVHQPFLNEHETKSFKKFVFHLKAYMIEKDNKLLLFEANQKAIFIWDYDNNNAPIKEISIGLVFDICIWNKDHLWASTNEGFKLVNINEGTAIKIIDEDKTKRRNGSKIRKINSPKENESIIGIDSNRILSLWTY